MDLIVNYDSLLIDYLFENIKDKSKNNIKTLLKNSIYVNGKNISRFDYKLKKGDKISIILKKIKEIDVIYEDNDIIVVNKPYGLLTVATAKEKEKTLYHYVLEYLKRKKQKVFVVHRLDKDTSGIIMFAKNEKVKNLFQNNWDKLIYTRKYIAVLEGNIEPVSGTLKSYLTENKNFRVYSTSEKNGKLALTKYHKIKSNDNYSLVDIEILTGRKNQIRVCFADIGFPVVGDNKYGNASKTRMYLHASLLEFKHPIKGIKMIFEANIPNDFDKLMKKGD